MQVDPSHRDTPIKAEFERALSRNTLDPGRYDAQFSVSQILDEARSMGNEPISMIATVDPHSVDSEASEPTFEEEPRSSTKRVAAVDSSDDSETESEASMSGASSENEDIEVASDHSSDAESSESDEGYVFTSNRMYATINVAAIDAFNDGKVNGRAVDALTERNTNQYLRQILDAAVDPNTTSSELKDVLPVHELLHKLKKTTKRIAAAYSTDLRRVDQAVYCIEFGARSVLLVETRSLGKYVCSQHTLRDVSGSIATNYWIISHFYETLKDEIRALPVPSNLSVMDAIIKYVTAGFVHKLQTRYISIFDQLQSELELLERAQSDAEGR